MWKSALHLAAKDIKLFFRDRTALSLSLVLPIVLATVFGTAMKGMSGGGSGGGIKALTLVVQDEDRTDASQKLITALTETDGIRVQPETDGRAVVRNGQAAMALVVPAGYGQSLQAGEIPDLLLLKDPSRSLAVQVLSGRMLPALIEQNLDMAKGPAFRNFLGKLGFPEDGMDDAVEIFEGTFASMDLLTSELEAQGAFEEENAPEESSDGEGEAEGGAGFDFLNDVPEMLGLRSEEVIDTTNQPASSAGVSHAFAAMAVMMLMFSLVAGAGTLLDEKEQGTLMRLQLIPNARDAILLGKTMLLGTIGLLQLAMLFLFGMFAFDVPVLEHLTEIVVISLATVAACAAMGMLFATLSKTRKQLEGSSTLVILGMSALGGAWFPREMTPDIFQKLGNFTLTAWSMDAYHGSMWYGKKLWPTEVEGSTLAGIWPQIAVLLAIAVVLGLIARWAFRRRFFQRA